MGTTPIKNKPLIEQLWERANIKYGFCQQRINPVMATMSRTDLVFELECRHYQINHLMKTLERFTDWNQVENAFRARNDAYGMVPQLASTLISVKNNTAATDPLSQSEYQRIITLPNHSTGSFYVNRCERLSTEIMDAELRCMFPDTHATSIEWNCILGSGDAFQPKIGKLMDAIQRDINSLSLNNYQATLRTKIGFIGYTSSGKTTLMCRLLGMNGSLRGQFLPVHTTKSTYCPLRYNRDDPLINPDDQRTTTAVEFVDIQGCDKGNNISSGIFEAGNYLDEILKADCDIYVIVFNQELDNDQYQWIIFIKENMKRQCLLVRSKVDEAFLAKFFEKRDVFYAKSPAEERNEWSEDTIADLRQDFAIEGHHVYLTAANYRPTNSDAELLLQNQSSDFQGLLDELSRLAPLTRNPRVHSLAVRAVARVINSCFRCSYVIKVMQYKLATGYAAIIPFGDTVPRYLARKDIQQAYGITEDFLESLKQRHLQIFDGQLQTSVFKSYVTILSPRRQSNNGLTTSAHAAIGIAAASDALADDRARVALGIATFGAGIVLLAGVCAWSVVNTGKHILRHVNGICDDLIIVSIPLIESMMRDQPPHL